MSAHSLALIWPALSFALVSLAYWGYPELVFAKRSTGTLPTSRQVLLAPFLILTWGTWHLLRLLSREPRIDALTSDILIGRRCLPGEYFPDTASVVDLTWEFEQRHPRSRAIYLCHPILDGAAPDPRALSKLASEVATLPRPVLIHCAQGHGRTGLVAAALLMHLDPTISPELALARVVQARPGVRLNGQQLACLAAMKLTAA